MPLSSPGIIATAIYAFIQAWNEYVYALTFLNSKEKLTLPVGLQRFFTEYATDWPGLMAASFIMSVPVVVLFLVLQRYFVRALTEGAVEALAGRAPMARGDAASERREDATATSSPSITSRSTVEDGEFVALVGPSGCGKTTTLNLIAGLIDDHRRRDLHRRPAGQRPRSEGPRHRDGLPELRALSEQDRLREPRLSAADAEARQCRDREARCAPRPQVLDIEHLLERRPRELSGGQQQRVALGRALVRDPQAFLMDEPLSNLDAKLRVQMRAELKRFHQDLNATVIYVTHDQLEAVTMADKMAVMNGGAAAAIRHARRDVRQSGQHLRRGLRRQPGDEPAAGQVASRTRRRCAAPTAGHCRLVAGKCPQGPRAPAAVGSSLGARHSHASRPQMPRRPARCEGRVYTVEPTGDITYVHVHLGCRGHGRQPRTAESRSRPDEPIWIAFDQEHLHLFDARRSRR